MLRRLAVKFKQCPRSALLLHGKSAAKLSTSSSNVPDNKNCDEDDGDKDVENTRAEHLNIFLDLSNLIFDIKEKISDKEYKDIMETMSKLKNN